MRRRENSCIWETARFRLLCKKGTKTATSRRISALIVAVPAKRAPKSLWFTSSSQPKFPRASKKSLGPTVLHLPSSSGRKGHPYRCDILNDARQPLRPDVLYCIGRSIVSYRPRTKRRTLGAPSLGPRLRCPDMFGVASLYGEKGYSKIGGYMSKQYTIRSNEDEETPGRNRMRSPILATLILMS